MKHYYTDVAAVPFYKKEHCLNYGWYVVLYYLRRVEDLPPMARDEEINSYSYLLS